MTYTRSLFYLLASVLPVVYSESCVQLPSGFSSNHLPRRQDSSHQGMNRSRRQLEHHRSFQHGGKDANRQLQPPSPLLFCNELRVSFCEFLPSSCSFLVCRPPNLSIPVYKFLSEAYRDIRMLAISPLLLMLNSRPTLFVCFSQLRGSQVRSVMVQAETNRQGLPPGQHGGCGRLFGHTIFNQILQRSYRLQCPPCNNIWSIFCPTTDYMLFANCIDRLPDLHVTPASHKRWAKLSGLSGCIC